MKSLFKVLSIVLFSTLMFSCTQDDNGSGDDNISASDDKNNLKKGQIEIKGYPNNSNKMSFRATASKITIDWGDGSVDELTPNGVESEFVHEYANQNFQTIKINTETMTYVSLNGYSATYNELRFGDCPDLKKIICSSNKLTVLSIKSAPALTSLDCYGNQLTSLNVSGCSALTSLDCRRNQLTLLNISGCAALPSLNCEGNQLTSLNVSGCAALTNLDCGNNQLTSLNVSSCAALEILGCYD